MQRRILMTMVIVSSLMSACAKNDTSLIKSETDIFGYGLDVSAISATIYQIDVRMKSRNNVEAARKAAMLRAAKITLSRG